MNFNLNIETKYWNKETNSLFDYETNDLNTNQLCLNSSGNLYHWDKGLVFTEHKMSMGSKLLFMSSIKQTKDNYLINFENEKTKENPNNILDDKLWIVIRHTYFLDNLGWKIKIGDIIKLGKITMKVKETYLKNHHNQDNLTSILKDKELIEKEYMKIKNIENLENNEDNKLILNTNKSRIKSDTSKLTSKKKTSLPICRICLFDDNDKANPLINPCKCSGSMKYIHINCIKAWINSRLIIKKLNHLVIYNFKSVECEICKVGIPEKVRIKDQSFCLLGIERPNDSNYLILESVFDKKIENKNIYVFLFKEKDEIQIGRGNDADIRITDISVSRCHALIRINNNNFFLKDTFSKFGSLVQVPNEIMTLPNRFIALQIGKAFVTFLMKKTILGLLNCCFKYNNIYNINDYNGFFELKWNFTKENVFHCDNASESIIEDEMTQNEIINIKDQTDFIEEGKRMEQTEDFFMKKNEKYENVFEVRLKSDNIHGKESENRNDKKTNNKTLINKLTGLKTFQTTNSDILKDTVVNEASRNVIPAKNFFSDRDKFALGELKEKEIMSKLMMSPNINKDINFLNEKVVSTILGKFSPINHSKDKNFESKCRSVNMIEEINWKTRNKIAEILENRKNDNKSLNSHFRLKDDSVISSEHNQSCLILKKHG